MTIQSVVNKLLNLFFHEDILCLHDFCDGRRKHNTEICQRSSFQLCSGIESRLGNSLSMLSIARRGGSNNSKAAMFEAGCKTGFFDGARNAADGAQQPA